MASPQTREMSPIEDRPAAGDVVKLETPAGVVPLALDYSAVRYLSELISHAEGDVLGVVVGTRTAGGLLVRRFEPLRENPGTPIPEPARLRDAMVQLVEHTARAATPETGEPIGIFRSQRQGASSLTEFDWKVIRRCLPYVSTDGKFFLLIRTFAQRPPVAALFPSDGELLPGCTRPAVEFPFDEYLLRHGYQAEAPPLAPQPGLPIPVLENRKNLLLVVGLVSAGVVIGAGAWTWLQRSREVVAPQTAQQPIPLPGHTLGLDVSRKGTDLEIAWNSGSAAVLSASGGTLTIRNGPMTRVVALTADQLREGRIWFAPLRGEDLDLRLEVSGAGGRSDAESVQVLNWDKQPPAKTIERRSPVTVSAGLVPRVPSRDLRPAPPPVPPAESPAAVPQRLASADPSLSPVEPKGTPAPPPSVPTATVAAPVAPPPVSVAEAKKAPDTSPPPTAVAEAKPSPQNISTVQLPVVPPTQPAVAERPKPAAPQSVFTGATPIRKTRPILTSDARAELRRAPGRVTVTVRVDIDENGAVKNAEAVAVTGQPSEGGAYLKVASLASAKQWIFRPATLNGKNAPSQMTILFEF